jgi:hypothetical protein
MAKQCMHIRINEKKIKKMFPNCSTSEQARESRNPFSSVYFLQNSQIFHLILYFCRVPGCVPRETQGDTGKCWVSLVCHLIACHFTLHLIVLIIKLGLLWSFIILTNYFTFYTCKHTHDLKNSIIMFFT